MHARGFGCYNLGVFLGRLAFSLILFPSAFAKGERGIEFVRVGTSRAFASRISGCAEGHTACVTGLLAQFAHHVRLRLRLVPLVRAALACVLYAVSTPPVDMAIQRNWKDA